MSRFILISDNSYIYPRGDIVGQMWDHYSSSSPEERKKLAEQSITLYNKKYERTSSTEASPEQREVPLTSEVPSEQREAPDDTRSGSL